MINDEELARSSVVANSAMNRERHLAGPNSYARELRFHPLDWLRARLTGSADSDKRTVAWLDLCCGSGRALAQAAWELRRDSLADRITLVGVDLVDYFDPVPAGGLPLRLISAPIAEWTPTATST